MRDKKGVSPFLLAHEQASGVMLRTLETLSKSDKAISKKLVEADRKEAERRASVRHEAEERLAKEEVCDPGLPVLLFRALCLYVRVVVSFATPRVAFSWCMLAFCFGVVSASARWICSYCQASFTQRGYLSTLKRFVGSHAY